MGWVRSLTVIALTFGAASVEAFKEQEFKKCADSGFCERLRGKQGDSYSADPKSIQLNGAVVTAKVQHDASGAAYDLQLTNYNGILRMHIDEAASKHRFQVPWVLQSELPDSSQAWTKTRQSSSLLQLQSGSAQLTLTFKPLRVDLSIAGTPAASFNARQMFQYEYLREKQEGDPAGWWEETFKGHTDSKPKGPQAISLDLSFPGFQHVYGIPEHAASFALKPTTGEGIESEPYRLYNLDVFEYNLDSTFGLYGSIPLMLAHKAGLTTAAFWLNAAEMLVDVASDNSGTQTQWVAEAGVLDLFFLLGPDPATVLQQYGRISGTTAMPQMFSLGYHQCRWNYKDETDVLGVNAGFDQHDIPYDVIWLDIEYLDDKKYFTWDKNYFPTPIDMQDKLAVTGRKLVVIIDPHIKRKSDYYVFSEGESGSYFTKNKDGKDYEGWCWPGSSSWVDCLNPASRDWWAGLFSLSRFQGSTKNLYIWNDMNEPSVFNGPEVTMPKDNIHHGGVEHREMHNINGALFHAATWQGLEERGRDSYGSDGDRPFILTRSAFAGTQRLGALWTGDNKAEWPALKFSVPMCLSLSIAGLPFVGADIAGFFGNPDAELFTRWYQLGAFYPFFRGHAHLEAKRREPWLYDGTTTDRVREAIRMRYALLPYVYTLFRLAHTHNQPLMRPLWYEFPDEAETFSMDDQFLLGPSILVAPVTEAGASSREVYLPTSTRWYNFHSGTAMKPASTGGLLRSQESPKNSIKVDMDSIPIFLRGGSIVPRQERARRSSLQMQGDPFTLIVALNDSAAASGALYLDDGHSFAYKRGVYTERALTYADTEWSIRLSKSS
ncbi:hypothetical protein WJX84_003134 [Apatococcus fuscideae]|uniref:Glucosidase II subunit alpha n=1 Tax=Apatococcus fuscideae TaxID=2026836 RepID=A0AAW1SVP7_9CHLO